MATDQRVGRSSNTTPTKESGVHRNYPTPFPVDYEREPYVKHRDQDSNIEHEVPVDDEDYIGRIDGRPHRVD